MSILRYVTIFLFCSVVLFAESYHFVETRYSDALGRSMELRGVISLSKESLAIRYDESDKLINYEDEELSITEDGEELELGDEEQMKLSQYFELVLLLFNGDEKTLSKEFGITTTQEGQTLVPRTELSEYIRKIELKKEGKKLKTLKMFLSNDDKIKISIDDEVR